MGVEVVLWNIHGFSIIFVDWKIRIQIHIQIKIQIKMQIQILNSALEGILLAQHSRDKQ